MAWIRRGDRVKREQQQKRDGVRWFQAERDRVRERREGGDTE